MISLSEILLSFCGWEEIVADVTDHLMREPSYDRDREKDIVKIHAKCSCGWSRFFTGVWSNEPDARLVARKSHWAHACEVAP